MNEKRLNNLVVLNIEADLTKSVNDDSIIDEFVNQCVLRKICKYLHL